MADRLNRAVTSPGITWSGSLPPLTEVHYCRMLESNTSPHILTHSLGEPSCRISRSTSLSQANMISSLFLKLPLEIRELFYHEVLNPTNNKQDLGNDYKGYQYDLRFFRTCQQVYHEAREVFRRNNVFVAVETPWPEAQHQVAVEGAVPLVVTGPKAQQFRIQHLTVVIDSPQYSIRDRPDQRFIILVEDLPLFTEMWYYSQLTYPGMNSHLQLTLKLRDPYQLSFEQQSIPKSLQRKLLQPFGRVKGLLETIIQGEHYESIEVSMRAAMAEPYPTVEKCLEEATKIKDEGNKSLKNEQYQEALRLYREAFLHLMIIVDGRRRSIWGDAYFHSICQGGMYDKQPAEMVRIILRIRLVSNTILAHLKLEDYEEAKFWGMRTITLLQGPHEGDGAEVSSTFPAIKELGKIYYRTGIACRELGEKGKARDFLKFAAKCLPNDQIVSKDLAALSPRIL